MILLRRTCDGKPEQEVELEWGGDSGWIVLLTVREDVESARMEATAALDPQECRALAANLLQMADRFEKER